MKKLISLVLAAAMMLGVGSAVTAKAEEEKTYTVGICQLVQHAALDAATQGFMDALTEKLGDNVKFDLQNAQGETTMCSTIVTGFVANEYDLIMANATPALLAAVAATDTIPILGTSVTDYGTALAIDDMDAAKGTGHQRVRAPPMVFLPSSMPTPCWSWFPMQRTLLFCTVPQSPILCSRPTSSSPAWTRRV